jgi:hypothetical protein
MKLDVKAFGLACGVLWGLAVLVVALVNLSGNGYGQPFLNLLASWYPGYHAVPRIGEALLVGVYAFVDGLIGGGIFAWLYNRLTKAAS